MSLIFDFSRWINEGYNWYNFLYYSLFLTKERHLLCDDPKYSSSCWYGESHCYCSIRYVTIRTPYHFLDMNEISEKSCYFITLSNISMESVRCRILSKLHSTIVPCISTQDPFSLFLPLFLVVYFFIFYFLLSILPW